MRLNPKRIGGWCLIAIAITCQAQQDKKNHDHRVRPNLTGHWVLDHSKSKLSKSQRDMTDYVMTIVHREPEIKIIKKFKQGGRDYAQEWSYYTDGRPDRLSLIGNIEVFTRWRGRKLYHRVKEKRSVLYSSLPYEDVLEDQWELSEDGLLLKRTLSRSTLGGSPGSNSGEPSTESYVFFRRKY
jgi:hypothetical protein